MKYDVVIRCKNEMDWLPRVIESIKNQSIKPSKIILVDNSSNDGSQDFALEQNCKVINFIFRKNIKYQSKIIRS